MMIRVEAAGDADAIGVVTQAAFADHPHSDQTEHLILARLRQHGALALSLVAEEAGEIVGHIAFSPVSMSDGAAGWFGLGPVSVAPDFQGQGCGRRLIEAGLERLAESGAAGCVVMGDPDLYRRFGFIAVAGLVLPDCAPQYFLARALSGPMASGIVSYHSAFFGGAAEITNG